MRAKGVAKLNASADNFADEFAALLNRKSAGAEDIDMRVKEILRRVKSEGDKAVIEYAAELDNTDLRALPMRVDKAEIKDACKNLSQETTAALKLAEKRIRAYHEKLLPQDFDITDEAGVRLGARWTALSAVGLYIPGGTAAYPSSFLMNVIPAQVAGVERIAVATPAIENKINAVILAVADLLGIDEIYRIGGAHAVAALAYGTETIAAVDKITGPGNAYVATAKKQVFGTVGIDMIAGPSEVLIAADAHNNAAWIAADLLSQAEHDPAAQAILLTDSAELAAAVEQQTEEILQTLPRRDIAERAWYDYGAIISVADIHKDAPALIDKIAPEHLQLAVADADDLMRRVSHAGAIFLGAWTPEAIGDYIGGPNHVLPTSGTARFAEGLGVGDFLKRSSFIECSPNSFTDIGTAARHLAELEGLHAHGLSLDMRLKDNDG